MLRLITTATLAMAAAAPAYAGTVLAYDTTNGTSIAATVVGNTVTGDDLVRGSGVTQNAGGTFNSRGWDTADLAGAELAGDYLEWGFSSIDNYFLQQLDIAYDRSNTGPMSVALFADVNGDGFEQIFLDTDVDARSEISQIDLILSPVDFSKVSDVTFRLFGWGASTAAGTFDLESGNVGTNEQFGISLLGVVPLPAGLPLLAGGLGLLGLMRRKA